MTAAEGAVTQEMTPEQREQNVAVIEYWMMQAPAEDLKRVVNFGRAILDLNGAR